MAHIPRLTLVFLLMSTTAGAQTTPPNQTVLFVCEHGTVKSLLAKTLFEQYAKEVGLNVSAQSRGTHADLEVPAWMKKNLADDGLSIAGFGPRQLLPTDLESASLIVLFDVPDAATAIKTPRVRWDGLPSVTESYTVGRDAIKAKVHRLVDSLKHAAK